MRKKARGGGKGRKGREKIIQGHNQNALVDRLRVRIEERGRDLQIVCSWRKKEIDINAGRGRKIKK